MPMEIAGLKVERAAPRGPDGHAYLVLMEPGWESIARDVADWLERAVAPAPATKEPR